MWISKSKLERAIKTGYESGYTQGFQMGQLHALKEILWWGRILESGPMDKVVEEIEEILRREGL